jgi:hypothetical protein
MNSEDITDIKVSIAKIVMATETNIKNISSLTGDIKELTQDLKDSLCGKKECEELARRVAKVEGKVETIEGVPNALMKRFVMILVGTSALYVATQIGLK